MYKYLYGWYRYFTDWSCPHKKRYFFGLLAIDVPVLSFDFGFVAYFQPIMKFMSAFFWGDLGVLLQYGVAVLAILLTWERLKQAKFISRQQKNQPPPPSKDE